MNAKDLKITAYSPLPGGVAPRSPPRGISVEHLPSGCVAVCVKYHSQHLNREAALAAIEFMLKYMEQWPAR